MRLAIISDSALIITVVVHEDLSHLPVIEIVEVPHCVLRSGYQIQQHMRRLNPSHELMLQVNYTN